MEKRDYKQIYEERQTLYQQLREKYNPEGSKLRIYQKHLTRTLVEFDEFCKKHGITYYLMFGTLLGAIRHKGFIPWDDDMDILIDRENWNKLKCLIQFDGGGRLSDNVYVAFGVRPELWSPPFAYVDIFILDGSPDNKFLRTLKTHIAELICMTMKARIRIDAHNFKKPKLWFIFMPIAIFCRADKLKKMLDTVSLLWTAKDYSTQCYQVYNDCVKMIHRLFPKKDEIWKVDEASFEEHVLPVPSGWEELLTICYGNFMSIPKHENIHVHSIVEQLNDDVFDKM